MVFEYAGGCPLVVYSLRSTELPQLRFASLPTHAAPGSCGSASIHGFVLGEWVESHGPKAYLHMLESVAELINDGQLSLDGEADLLLCGTTPRSTALARADDDARGLPARFNAPSPDAQHSLRSAVSSLEPQPVLTGDEMVRRGLIPSFNSESSTIRAAEADSSAETMPAARIAAAISQAVGRHVAHETQERGVWAERRKVVLSFGTTEEAADEAVELGHAITELAQKLEWHGTKPYRPGEGPAPRPEPEPEPEPKTELAPDADQEDEVEEARSVAANERARRVEALSQSNSSPKNNSEPESQPEPGRSLSRN